MIVKDKQKRDKVVQMDEFKKRKEKPFDVIAFAKRKLLEDNPKNSKYFE